VTVPFAAFRTVPIEANLPPSIAHLIAALPYVRVGQVHVVPKGPLPGGLPQTLWTDDPALGRVFFGGATGRRPHIKIWLGGPFADLADRMAEKEVLTRSEAALRRALPELPPFEAVRYVSWQNDAFSRGAYHAFGPGQRQLLAEAVEAETGRLHFAGEHLSRSATGMEAAAQSGERVARRIIG
jgi:monoamine oxidase